MKEKPFGSKIPTCGPLCNRTHIQLTNDEGRKHHALLGSTKKLRQHLPESLHTSYQGCFCKATICTRCLFTSGGEKQGVPAENSFFW